MQQARTAPAATNTINTNTRQLNTKLNPPNRSTLTTRFCLVHSSHGPAPRGYVCMEGCGMNGGAGCPGLTRWRQGGCVMIKQAGELDGWVGAEDAPAVCVILLPHHTRSACQGFGSGKGYPVVINIWCLCTSTLKQHGVLLHSLLQQLNQELRQGGNKLLL